MFAKFALERLKTDITEDTFTHADKLYDLSKTRILMRNQETFLLPIKELLWVLKFDKPDEDRVFHAKFRYPLLVAKWQGHWTVVDGLHRLERYRRRGIEIIPVKHVTDDILQKSLIHK